MLEREQAPVSVKQQLEELLRDPDFQRIIELSAREVARIWNIPSSAARSFVLSAIGVPGTLESIHQAWARAKQDGEFGLAKLMVRRRVIDLLRKDARPAGHCSSPVTLSAVETARAPGSFDDLVQRDPHAQLELKQVIHMVRGALACFAARGRAQQRQAQLLCRYALDEKSYAELAVELECSAGALRVRVHKAMLALRRHIRACHPELEELLERDRGRLRAAGESGPASSAYAAVRRARDPSRHKPV